MKKITITGGKGGTGKSTLAVLLSKQFMNKGFKVLLVDCDVECPNIHLLIGKNLIKPQTKVFVKKPFIDYKKCKQCGLCAKNCPENAIFIPPQKKPIIINDLCSGCGACWLTCPHQAIKTKDKEIGEIYFNKIDKKLSLLTGLAKPALQETSLIVKKLKGYSLELARKNKVDFIIYDAAAGTHCPVIAALLDSDLAYVVTEPTPLGAHDLDLILKLITKMGLKNKTILNQADLGDDSSILKILKKYKKRIDKKVPYSKKIAEYYARGNLLDYQL